MARSGWSLNDCILPAATGCQVPKGLKRKHLIFPSFSFEFFWALNLLQFLGLETILLFSLASIHLLIDAWLFTCFYVICSKLHQTDGIVWSGERPASPELLKAALGSLLEFFSNFSEIIQLFYHSVSLSSREPSGERNLNSQLPHRRIMKNSCLKSTLWESTFKTELLMPWQTSALLHREGMSRETDYLKSLLIR